jgi:hypothetical protein
MARDEEFIEALVKDVLLQAQHWDEDRHIIQMDGGWDYDHNTAAGERCSCDPINIYTDPLTGYNVYLHRTLEA